MADPVPHRCRDHVPQLPDAVHVQGFPVWCGQDGKPTAECLRRYEEALAPRVEDFADPEWLLDCYRLRAEDEFTSRTFAERMLDSDWLGGSTEEAVRKTGTSVCLTTDLNLELAFPRATLNVSVDSIFIFLSSQTF